MCAAIHRTRTVPSSLLYFVVDFTYSLTLSHEVLYDSHYSGYGFTRLSVHHRHCGRGSMCSAVRLHIPRHSSRTLQRSRHHHRHHKPIGYILMAPKNKQLKKVYFDPKRVASYSGVDDLRRVTRMPRKIVEEWLSEQDAYVLY